MGSVRRRCGVMSKAGNGARWPLAAWKPKGLGTFTTDCKQQVGIRPLGDQRRPFEAGQSRIVSPAMQRLHAICEMEVHAPC